MFLFAPNTISSMRPGLCQIDFITVSLASCTVSSINRHLTNVLKFNGRQKKIKDISKMKSIYKIYPKI